MFNTFFFVALLFFFHAARGAVPWTATPFNPPSVPLAIRSPYLSAWLSQGAGTALSAAWPTFWNGETLGWAGFVNVDGTSYNFLGNPGVPGADFKAATQKSLTWTSTQSNFVMTAGPVDLNITFLSPVEPSSVLNQSLPFSYLAVSASPNDGNSHSVQIYTDISAEWVSGNDSQLVNWTSNIGQTVITHQVQLETQTLFTEVNDRIQQGSAYYSTQSTAGTTYQTGQDVVVRAQFIKDGTLANTLDTEFRSISDDWPVFAFAHDFGAINGPSEDVVFAIGHARDPAIHYAVANGTFQDRRLYLFSQYKTVDDAIATFLGDYSNAVVRAQAFDAQVNADASKISSDYASIVALVIRQAFGAIETTFAETIAGGINTSDVTVFMKEISSAGDVSTVDVIFPTWPLFLYTNPVIGKYLLLPLFEYQATGQYPNQWAMHDLGPAYPQAPGYPQGNDEPMPIEESGNMLIMTLSYVQRTNDTSLITNYYKLLDQWAQYLVANTLIPANQLSTDDFAGALANQTNLAIKGIIGIKAMSEIASIAGNSAASANYSSIAESYIPKWQSLATASDGLHLTLSYDNSSSWGLSYNMYADKLLSTNLIPDSVYEMQTAWYPTVANAYGVALDTRHTYVLTDWEVWTAAIMTNTSVRDLFLDAVYKFSADGLNNEAYDDWYDTTTGKVECGAGADCFRARPVVGGHLALLALPSGVSGNVSTNSSGTGPSSSGSGSSRNSTTPNVKSLARRTLNKESLNWMMNLALAIALPAVIV